MENNNDKSKTEKFTPTNKNSKPEINRSENDAYSGARRTPEYDFSDAEDGSNKKLVIITVLLAIFLVVAIVLSVFIIGSTKKDDFQEEAPVQVEETLEEEEEESTPKGYNIVFYGESVIEKNGYSIIDADLFDEEMTKVATRKIKISPETRIIKNGKSINQKSLVYLIESVVDEKIVFEGKIMEEDGLALKLVFEYYAEEIPEEEIFEETTEGEPSEQEPVDDPLEAPAENQGISVE